MNGWENLNQEAWELKGLKIRTTVTKNTAFLLGGGQSCDNLGDGEYQDTTYCNRFYTCTKGIATVQLCPQGLLFNPASRECRDTAPCPRKWFIIRCGWFVVSLLHTLPMNPGKLDVAFLSVSLMFHIFDLQINLNTSVVTNPSCL